MSFGIRSDVDGSNDCQTTDPEEPALSKSKPSILDHVQALAAFARTIDSQHGYDKNLKLGCKVVGLVSMIPDLALCSF